MAAFTTDTFTDTAGVLLENHTGETGATWTKNPAFGTGSAAISNANRVRGNATNGVYYASGTPASADYDVEADLTVLSGVSSAGIAGRMSVAAATYYLFDYEFGTSQWKLYTVVNGATQNTTTFTQTLTNGVTYHMRLALRGSQITCYVNGVQVIQITDSNITAAGRAGIFFGAATTDSTGYHLDNLNAAPTAAVPVTDANVFFSPYNWYSDGGGTVQSNNVKGSSTYAQTSCPGAYLKLSVSASASGYVALLLDTTPLNGITAANCPTLSISVDGQAFTSQLLAYATGTTRVALGPSLAAGTHTVIVYFKSVTLSSSLAMGDRWTAPASAVKVTGLEVDSRGTATAAQTLRSKRAIVYGDSILEGADCVGSTNANADQDATQTFAQLLGQGLDAETGIIGFSGQGWTVAGYGNVPALYNATDASQAWNKHFAGQSRLAAGLFAPAPDVLVVLHGKNDGSQGAADATVTSAVSTWLAAARTAAGVAAKIFVVITFDGTKRSALLVGFSAYQASTADGNAKLIDLGTAIQSTLASGGLNTNDAIHPNTRGHATFGAMLVRQLQSQLDGPGTYPGADGNFSGNAVTLSTGNFAV